MKIRWFMAINSVRS